MSAAEALKAARAAGIRVEIDGDDLMLEASAPPPSAVVSALARQKPAIVSLLRQAADTRSADDLRTETFEERAALIEYGTDVPREWAEGFARLDLGKPPTGFDQRRWRTLVDDGGRFLDRWGGEAAALGWSALDVFGVHPVAPGARCDVIGLVPLISGGDIVAITERSATIRSKGSGSTLTYLRTAGQGAVALWELFRRP